MSTMRPGSPFNVILMIYIYRTYYVTSSEQRPHLVPEPLELACLVGDRPDEHVLYARLRERAQLLREQFRRSDRETLAECLLGSVHRGHDAFLADAPALVAVVRDVTPHRGERVRKRVGRLAIVGEVRTQRLPLVTEQLRCCVVRGGEPAVGETADAAKTRVRTPAAHPDRRSVRLCRPRFQ